MDMWDENPSLPDHPEWGQWLECEEYRNQAYPRLAEVPVPTSITAEHAKTETALRFIDDHKGWNFHDGNSVIARGDYIHHGQHVARYAANQGTGFDLMFVRIGDNWASITRLTKAVDYVVDLKKRHSLPIVALNISYGGGFFSDSRHLFQPSYDAASNAGILVVASAGNNGRDNDVTPHYPSGFSGVIGVTTSNADGSYAGRNYGRQSVALGAPAPSTSFAAPIVSGAIGQFAAQNPWATADQIQEALWSSIVPHPTMTSRTKSGGSLLGPIKFAPAPTPPAPAPAPAPAPVPVPPPVTPPSTFAALPRPTSLTAVDLDSPSWSPVWEQVSNAFDGTAGTKYLNSGGPNSGMEFTYGVPTQLSSFVITTANDVPDRDPATYQVHGFQSGSWQLLTSGGLQLPAARFTDSAPVALPTLPSLTQYRVIFPTLKGTGTMMQIAELKLFGSQSTTPGPSPTPLPPVAPPPVTPPPVAPPPPAPAPDPITGQPASITAVDLDSPSWSPIWEQVGNAFDNNPATKYLNRGGANSGVELTYSTPRRISSFAITTANDMPDRDPASYEVHGFHGGSWQVLASGGLQLPAARFTDSARITLPALPALTQFRMVFPTLKGSGMMQIADLHLGYDPNPLIS